MCSPMDEHIVLLFFAVRPWANACFSLFGLFVHRRSCVFFIFDCPSMDERMFF